MERIENIEKEPVCKFMVYVDQRSWGPQWSLLALGYTTEGKF